MGNENLSNEDVSAMRRQGDFKAFMRQAIKGGQQNFREAQRPAPPTLPPSPGHIPGAWPTGPADTAANTRTTCTCTRCQSYAKNQPDLDRLLHQTRTYLDNPNA